jgi:hypothetical protein
MVDDITAPVLGGRLALPTSSGCFRAGSGLQLHNSSLG